MFPAIPLKSSFRFLRSTAIPFVLLGLVLLGLLWGWGWVSLELQFLGYKGSVAAMGPDPRLTTVGVSFPPLLVLGTAILGSPLLLQLLLGTVVVVWWWQLLAQLPVGVGWRWLWGMLMVVQPSLGLMLLRSPSWAATAGLLSFNMLLLLPLSYQNPQQAFLGGSLPLNLRLVLLGLGLSPLMLLRWESWWLLPWMILLVVVALWREAWGFRATAVLVVSFMSVALILGWLYINWLAKGDPWTFTYEPGSGLRLPQWQAWLRSAGGWDSLLETGRWLLAVVPAYVLLGLVTFLAYGRGRWVWLLCWALPLVMVLASFWQGLFVPELSRFGIFWVLMPLLLGSYLRLRSRVSSLQKLGITVVLLLSLFSGGYVLDQGFLVPEEQELWQRLRPQAELDTQPPGQQELLVSWRAQRQAHRQVGQYLFQHLLPKERVLVDDALHFEAIFWARDPRLFITPHQYEFALALQQPQDWTDYLLLSGLGDPLGQSDRLLQFWPELTFGSLPGFLEVYGLVEGESTFALPGSPSWSLRLLMRQGNGCHANQTQSAALFTAGGGCSGTDGDG